ncbi:MULTISPECIES: chorismate--pyruvate lyase [unclassified Ruminococcus]|uniref:chorismate--pyruvate lyase n=1 Tax=unclassified Ruminococcus TaxID=2608920 RepID=UPI00210DA3D6|nr:MULTISPECIES: chorismate--pyruvate lyase [unclassified Ruminococcus]MCQ4021679.1 chorismate--pyruvate lyase [Ruminococcus sp. zg-924]MCQ4114124.1 chorismate--pyruvate lyase [Ruminococcus sp. zg-921]
MGPYYYRVNRIDGDYAYLIRTDILDNEEMIIARALLPEDIDISTNLKWENLVYTIID